MKLIKKTFRHFAVTLSLLLSSCSNRSDSKFEYIPLKTCAFEYLEIEKKTPFQVLSYSGGKACDKGSVIYYQYIAIDSSSGDTLRILSPSPYHVFDSSNAKASYSSLGKLGDLLTELYKNDSLKELVAFNKNQSSLEKRNYKTVKGYLAFDPKE